MSGSNLTTSYPAFQDLRQRNTTFSDMIGIYAYSEASLGGRDAGPKLRGVAVSGNYFDMLGVQPQIGRLFHAADERGLNSAPYVVLSDALWRRVFNGDPGVVGTTVRLERAAVHGDRRGRGAVPRHRAVLRGRTTGSPSSTSLGGLGVPAEPRRARGHW